METTSADKDLAVMKQQPGLKQGMGQGMPHKGSHENGSHIWGREIKKSMHLLGGGNSQIFY